MLDKVTSTYYHEVRNHLVECKEKERAQKSLLGIPEGIVPTVHLNVQGPDHHIHEEAAQQAQFVAAILIHHCSGTDQISLELHLQSHQIELPRLPTNLDFPSSNPIQIQEHRTLKESCEQDITASS